MSTIPKPDGQGHAVLELFPGLYFRRVSVGPTTAEWQVFRESNPNEDPGSRDHWQNAHGVFGFGDLRALDRIAELVAMVDPAAIEDANAEALAAPQYAFGDEFVLGGIPHFIVGQDEQQRYIVAPTDSLLAVTINGDEVIVSTANAVRHGE